MNKVTRLEVIELLVGLPGVNHHSLNVDMNGIYEDKKHHSPTRIADARKRPGYERPEKGTIDENWRMFSAITLEDLQVIQEGYLEKYGKEVGSILPGWLGPNIVFQGMDGFSKIPVDTVIDFPEGPAFIVTGENKSCATPGKLIANMLDLPIEDASYFVKVADGYRGVVGKIIRPGRLDSGMVADMYQPTIDFRRLAT